MPGLFLTPGVKSSLHCRKAVRLNKGKASCKLLFKSLEESVSRGAEVPAKDRLARNAVSLIRGRFPRGYQGEPKQLLE
jgi:hypothetical protein